MKAEILRQGRNFNSHAHVERDGMEDTADEPVDISTHTLTWSVTGRVLKCPDSMDISTHTLTWSVTVNTTLPVTNSQISTHTLTWSVTKQVADGLKEYSDFNSHAHVERDIVGAVFKIFHFISTHTLTWSVT